MVRRRPSRPARAELSLQQPSDASPAGEMPSSSVSHDQAAFLGRGCFHVGGWGLAVRAESQPVAVSSPQEKERAAPGERCTWNMQAEDKSVDGAGVRSQAGAGSGGGVGRSPQQGAGSGLGGQSRWPDKVTGALGLTSTAGERENQLKCRDGCVHTNTGGRSGLDPCSHSNKEPQSAWLETTHVPHVTVPQVRCVTGLSQGSAQSRSRGCIPSGGHGRIHSWPLPAAQTGPRVLACDPSASSRPAARHLRPLRVQRLQE